MKEILNKYKDRLINLSGKNRSLSMKKLYKKRAFDLSNLEEFKGDIYLEVLEYINNTKKKKYEIIHDYSDFRSREMKKIEDEYDKNLKILEEKFKEIENFKNDEKYIDKKEKLEKKLNESIERLNRKVDRLISYSESIKVLNKEVIDIEKETGKRELYIACPFVEGYFKDRTFFKAPLLLYQVSLSKEGDRWFLNNESEGKIIINKVFLLAIEKYNEVKISGFEDEYKEISNKVISDIVKKIKEFGVVLEYKPQNIEKFKEYTSNELPNYNLGTGKVFQNLLIGQFPLANSIYNDYMELIDLELNNNLLESLLKTGVESESEYNEEAEEHGKLSFREQELYLTSQLDYSQEIAVKKSNSSNKIVIYGPPGTGKSQTITNIISNGLANGKKILMVSQKRAALDVIYNRLGELNSKAVIIHDINNDKKGFYAFLSSALENIKTFNEDYFEQIKENNEYIDKKITLLEKLARALSENTDYGLTLQEMYSKTKEIKDKEDERFNKFLKYRNLSKVDKFNKISYKNIYKDINEINNEIIQAYLECTKLRKKNKLIDDINKELNIIEISEVRLNLEGAIENIKSINKLKDNDENLYKKSIDYLNLHKESLNDGGIEKLANNINEKENGYLRKKLNSGKWWILDSTKEEYYEFLKKKLEKDKYYISKDKLIKLADEYNENKNGYLKNKLNNKPWWNIIQWFKYSKNKKKEAENLIEFDKLEKEITKDFLEISEKISSKYYENDKIDRENEIEFKKRYNDILNKLKNVNKNFIKLIENLGALKISFSEIQYKEITDKFFDYKDITGYLKDYISAVNILDEYNDIIKIDSSITDIQRKALKYSQSDDGSIKLDDVRLIIQFSILQNILEIEKDPEIKEAISYIEKFEDIVTLTNEKMQLKQEAVRNFIIEKCNLAVEKLQYKKEFKEFKRQANKKRLLWPIRKYMENYSELVLDVFPCFLLGPETVSDILPMTEGLFDLVIFDEASQMYIEDAIPTIFRAKKVIVAGDDKQLRPNGTFKSTISSEVEEEEDSENLAALEEESLLDLAKVNYDKLHLTYHYRSQYEELISFSNYAFYDGKLKVAPNLISSSAEFRPIERVMCKNGAWIDRSNEEEANKIVEIIYKILKERKNNETLGIITFNINQKTTIENMLERKAQEDSVFRELYVSEIDRVENNEDVSLFVKNIENVQGDERDIIIFSIGYGRNENGRVSVNFGALSQDGGENRLNVAISRAKKKIYVVTSIEPEELNVESAKNKGPKLFKKYLQYVRAVSNGDKKEQSIILNSLVDSDIMPNKERYYDSDFEAEVYDMLVEKGYEVHTQVGVSGYRIDMAIYDNKSEKYILGIECDGAAYHSSKSARERDIHRQRYLECRGWNIIRVWSKHWWSNPINEIRRIENKVKEIEYNNLKKCN
ncbi:AAA domain-containing protein [Clostridium perfringens]